MSSSAVGTGLLKYVYPSLSPNSHTGPDGLMLFDVAAACFEAAFVVDGVLLLLADADVDAAATALRPDVPEVEAIGEPDVDVEGAPL